MTRSGGRGPVRRWLGRADATRALGSGAQLLARFGLIGLVSFVVDVGGFNLLRHVAELGPLTSKTLSVLAATTVAFVGNRSWTFSGRTHRFGTTGAYALFFAVNGLALVIGVGCLAFSSYVLGLHSPLAENISSNVVGVGLGTVFRFAAYDRLVFAARGTGSAAQAADPVDVHERSRAA